VLILLPQEYAPFQLREFATTGVGAVEGIKGLYALYEQAKDQNPGKVPLVQYVGATPTQIGRKGGRTNIPSFQITGWIDRPAAFDEPLGDDGNNQAQQQFVSQSGFAQPAQPANAGFKAAQPSPPPSQAATSVQPPQTDNSFQSASPQPDSGSLNKPVF